MRTVVVSLLVVSCLLVGCPSAGSHVPSGAAGPVASASDGATIDPPSPAVTFPPSPASSVAASPAPTATADATATPPATPRPTPSPSKAPVLSRAEARLLEELRSDSRIGCAPRRANLPPGSNVGVECVIGDKLVDRVGVYRFPAIGDPQPALNAYRARLKEQKVALGSGDCPHGVPGDANWPPYLPDEGLDGTGPSEMRIGCYRDENGIANIRLTCYGDIYIGIVGQNRDISRLYDWADRVAPDQRDDRDPPGICGRPD